MYDAVEWGNVWFVHKVTRRMFKVQAVGWKSEGERTQELFITTEDKEGNRMSSQCDY